MRLIISAFTLIVILSSCEEVEHTSTIHSLFVYNSSDFQIKIEFTNTDSSGSFILEPYKNTQNTKPLHYQRIYEEILDTGKDPKYNQTQLEERIKSLKIFKRQADGEFYEISVSPKLTNLVYWEIEESHDAYMNTVQDTRTYWLNITDEIAKN